MAMRGTGHNYSQPKSMKYKRSAKAKTKKEGWVLGLSLKTSHYSSTTVRFDALSSGESGPKVRLKLCTIKHEAEVHEHQHHYGSCGRGQHFHNAALPVAARPAVQGPDAAIHRGGQQEKHHRTCLFEDHVRQVEVAAKTKKRIGPPHTKMMRAQSRYEQPKIRWRKR